MTTLPVEVLVPLRPVLTKLREACADELKSHKFDASSQYRYFCGLHPKMTGTVKVA